MSDGTSIRFVDLAVFSFEFDRVRCFSTRSILVRNWCGVSATVTLREVSRFSRLQIGNVLPDQLRELDESLTLKNVDEVWC